MALAVITTVQVADRTAPQHAADLVNRGTVLEAVGTEAESKFHRLTRS